MSLSSFQYLGFLCVVIPLFYQLPRGPARERFILWISYLFFFLISPIFLIPLLFVTIVSYTGGIILEKLRGSKRQTLALFVLIFIAALPLLFYKYWEIAYATIHYFSPINDRALPAYFPLGISFYTLTAIAYLVDVYLDITPAVHQLNRLSLFFNFFPKLTAGPLERSEGLVPQFNFNRAFNSDCVLSGIKLILVGLVIKLAFADRVAETVTYLFENPRAFNSVELLYGTIFFTYYVYADFAGYSLIAIGSARILGIDLTVNFRQPLLSENVLDFWRNWHISLFLWLRDYIFTPLRFSFRSWGKGGLALALIITLLFSGIWHGAKLNYIFYAAIHAIFIICSIMTFQVRTQIFRKLSIPIWMCLPFKVLITFFLVASSFVVFATSSLTDALFVYRKLFSIELVHALSEAAPGHNSTQDTFKGLSPWIVILIAGDLWARYRPFEGRVNSVLKNVITIAFYNLCVLTIIYCYWRNVAAKPFLYFGF